VFTPGAYSGYNKAGINSTLNSKFQCKLLLRTTSLELYMKFQDIFGNTCSDSSTSYLSPFRVITIFLSLSKPEKKCSNTIGSAIFSSWDSIGNFL